MDISEQIVPAVVILIANLFSGQLGSSRYEFISACFGWAIPIGLVCWVLFQLFPILKPFAPYAFQVSAFCLITVLARDYEKILKPFFNAWLNRK